MSERPPSIVRERVSNVVVERRAEMTLESVLRVLDMPGIPIKHSRRQDTVLAGPFVVKRGRARTWRDIAAIAFRRASLRRPWDAALFLEQTEVPVPRAYAFTEFRRLGVTYGSALITEALTGCCSVEEYAATLVRRSAQPDEIRDYLARIAELVKALERTGAAHADLSGKNILTRDGTSFWLIDLDSVTVGGGYSSSQRLKNHVQLYDSFCDLWDDELLRPFLEALLPEDIDADTWFASVRKEQRTRRERTVASWERERRRKESSGG